MNHVLTEGMISDTMLNAASNLVAAMSGPLFVVCLLLIFFVLGFVVPSSSGLAVLAMPIFAPLADTVGIPRWIIVAAYQFGQYAMLYIAPTGLVMACLLYTSGLWRVLRGRLSEDEDERAAPVERPSKRPVERERPPWERLGSSSWRL